MNFDDLDVRLRVYETAHDQLVPKDVFVVARLTKEVLRLEAPFDLRPLDSGWEALLPQPEGFPA